MNESVSDHKNKSIPKDQLFFYLLFAILGLITLSLFVYFKIMSNNNSLEVKKIQSQRETSDLFQGVPLERDQRGLIRGRFAKIDGNSLFVEFYYRFTDGGANAQEAVSLSDKVAFNCEERYFVTSDGTKIDKLNAMTDTNNYNGEYVSGGRGIDWFKKNAKIGDAVEVRFLGDGSSRIPTQILLYRDKCDN